MAKWKVNKERINTDIPSADGTIQGGSVTYATKRLIVDAAKRVKSLSASERTYIKENSTRKKEERDGSDTHTPKSVEVKGLPIANYRGVDMRHALSGTTVFNHYFAPIDDDFNVGLCVKGYQEAGYSIPHINYGINDFWKRKSTNSKYGAEGNIVKFDEDGYFNNLEGASDSSSSSSIVKNNFVSYGCYPLMNRYADEKYNIKNEKGETIVDVAQNMLDVDLRNEYKIMSFIIEEEAKFKLGGWHFHTSRDVYRNIVSNTTSTLDNYKMKKSADGGYVLDSALDADSTGIHTLFFEYSSEIVYRDAAQTTTHQQLPWTDRQDKTPVILVRRLLRDSQGNVLRLENGEPKWKLCIHAKSGTKYFLKTWRLPSSTTVKEAFESQILKNVAEYDSEAFDKFLNSGLVADLRFYAEEADSSIGGVDDTYDKPSYILKTEDVLVSREHRFYDEVQREEWKETTVESVSRVDDTTRRVFKEYAQQIMPSTVIVKAEATATNPEENTVRDEKVRDLEPLCKNYTDWVAETLEDKTDEFVEAVFKVYFDKTDGENVGSQSYTITSKDEYDSYLGGGGSRNVTVYPQIGGEEPLFWFMAANKSIVEGGLNLPDSYKYGGEYQKIDLYKHSGIHFYPYMTPYDPFTVKVVFHSPKTDAVVLEKSKTLQTLEDYNKFLDGTLAADYVSVPMTLSTDGYNNQPVGFWVTSDKWDKTKLQVKADLVGDNDKYGEAEGLQRVNLSDKAMFGDADELHFYPYVGVDDVNHIVVSFNSNGNMDLDNATAIYDADTGEKLIGPVGWLSYYNPDKSKKDVYQYGYDSDTESIITGTSGGGIDNYFFGHSGDNMNAGYEGVYVYVNGVDKTLYVDDSQLSKLCPKSLQDLYPNTERFKIKLYAEWYDASEPTTLGTCANIKISAYKGGYPIRQEEDEYLIQPLTLKDGSEEVVKEYIYGGNNIPIWARSGDWIGNDWDILYQDFEKIYDFMGYILYDTTINAGEYVEPIIVGKRSGEYASPVNTANTDKWSNYPFYTDPDEYDISPTEKDGYVEASRLDGTTIYVKKK